jgi:hypothetical protein
MSDLPRERFSNARDGAVTQFCLASLRDDGDQTFMKKHGGTHPGILGTRFSTVDAEWWMVHSAGQVVNG